MNLQRQTKEYARVLRTKDEQIIALQQELLDTRAVCGALQKQLDDQIPPPTPPTKDPILQPKKIGKLAGTLKRAASTKNEK